jgi:L-amino acid N-acyltransferase YncA
VATRPAIRCKAFDYNLPMNQTIRPSTDQDIPAIASIYAHHVLRNTATFETEVPSQDEMAARRQDVLAKSLPYLVITQGQAGQSEVVGFAYANWFKPRAAYRFTCENSIYLRHNAAGKGLGKLLLAELLAQLERQGIRKALAVIGGSGNAASIGLHSSLGFVRCGLVEDYGYKFGQWLDLVLMQRTLGGGANQPPV